MWNSRDIDDSWLTLYLNLFLILISFIFVAPLSCTFFCGFLFFISGLLRFKKWTAPLFISLPILIFALMSLKFSLQFSSLTQHYSPIFTATALTSIACVWSMRLKSSSHAHIFLVILIACAGSQLLIEDSNLMLLWNSVVIFFVILNFLKLNLIEFSSEALLSSIKSAAQVTLYVLPLLSFIIFVFLRFSHTHPNLDFQGKMGVSDELAPGKIARLADDDAIAFRAFLSRPEIPFELFYWRGFTLDSTEGGLIWKKSFVSNKKQPHAPAIKKHFLSDEGCIIKQKIFIQANQVSDLRYALDRPLSLRKTKDGGYLAVSNMCTANKNKMSPQEKKYLIKLNGAISMQVKHLAETLWHKSKNARDYENKILQYFVTHQFKYSSFPKKRSHTLDDFLFNSKIGFCEHYAAAFATLLRLEQIPTRIVVGFVGGERNEFGNYWFVSMKDAHAWVEAYEEGHGWIRIDPSAVVKNDTFSHDKSIFKNLSDTIKLQKLRLLSDAAFFKMTLFFKNKKTLLSLDDLKVDPWLLFALLGFLLVLQYLKRKKRSLEVLVLQQFLKLCSTLAEKGIPKLRAEGFESYRQRVLYLTSTSSSTLDNIELDSLFQKIILLKYGPKIWTPSELFALKKRVIKIRRALKLWGHKK